MKRHHYPTISRGHLWWNVIITQRFNAALFEQIEILSGIQTVYSDCKYILDIYAQPSMMASSGFRLRVKALRGQLIRAVTVKYSIFRLRKMLSLKISAAASGCLSCQIMPNQRLPCHVVVGCLVFPHDWFLGFWMSRLSLNTRNYVLEKWFTDQIRKHLFRRFFKAQ